MAQEVIIRDGEVLRWCGGHQEYHDPDEFSASGGNGWCKKYRAEYYQSTAKAKRFGLTPDQLQELRIKQENKCAICDREVPLVIDHDHETGEVRGLLCSKCNVFLGWLESMQGSLERVRAYLGDSITV